jgi:hypothetical protein
MCFPVNQNPDPDAGDSESHLGRQAFRRFGFEKLEESEAEETEIKRELSDPEIEITDHRIVVALRKSDSDFNRADPILALIDVCPGGVGLYPQLRQLVVADCEPSHG